MPGALAARVPAPTRRPCTPPVGPPACAAIRPDPSRKAAVQYRVYCALHSPAQQARDEKMWQASGVALLRLLLSTAAVPRCSRPGAPAV